MEDSVKEQSSASETPGKSSSRLLRYPLRSSSKSKEEKPPLANSASSRRIRPESSVSKSVNVLNLSSQEKSAKPPRRLSIPSKSSASPASRSIGFNTPISEAKLNRSQVKNNSPVSEISRSSSIKKKFCVLSSASYWLSQIKISESAAKHNVSLGFFKLALESGCEPLHRMKEELKNYARKNNLTELEDSTKELFEKYGISESFEQLQVSETGSQVLDEGTRSSGEGVNSSSSMADIKQLKPKPINTTSSASTKQVKKPITQKNESVPKFKRSVSKNDSSGKKTQKPKQESKAKKCPQEEDSVDTLPVEEKLEENKENVDTPEVDEITRYPVISELEY